MFGDIRDEFLYGPPIPYLVPITFKPMNKHQLSCKICYTQLINAIFLPCKHKLFCMDCKDLMEEAICPLCGSEIRDCIQEYSNNNQ